jgi:3D (Asp-Asp-Asp) domain-containing protein
VEVEGLGTFVVLDRFGWDANAHRLDVWTPSCQDALRWGVRYRRVRVVHDP